MSVINSYAGGFLLPAIVSLVAASALAQGEDGAVPGFVGYDGAPDLSVVPRKDELVFYPCSQCHEFMEPNTTVRELMAPHEIELTHGKGRFWCYACHRDAGHDELRTVSDQAVDFDDAHLVCGGCHGLRHKDWIFGAHGKRLSAMDGDRVVYNCTHCHDAHDPVMAPRKPMAPPGVRTGLERAPPAPHERGKVWERHSGQDPETRHDAK